MAKHPEINDSEVFDWQAIEWTMLRTKNSCRVTMVAKAISQLTQ
jgi:hypothetical protein